MRKTDVAQNITGGKTRAGDNSTPAMTDTPGTTDPLPDGGDETPERGNRPNFDAAEKPSYTQANVYGNTSGNIGNRGYAAVQGDWIYYFNQNHDMLLYAMKTDGSCNQKLSNDVPLFINVVGDWVYYIDALSIQGSDKEIHQIYKVNIDGSGRQLVCEDSAGYITVIGDDIYYVNENDGFKVYTIKTDGTGRKKLTDDPALSIAVSGVWIYYSDNVNFYAIKTDGTGKKTLTNKAVPLVNVVGDKLYYTGLIDFMDTLCVINSDGSGEKILNYSNTPPGVSGTETENEPRGEEDALLISNEAELRAFADDVNSGNDYLGKFVTLTNDIALTGEWKGLSPWSLLSEYCPRTPQIT